MSLDTMHVYTDAARDDDVSGIGYVITGPIRTHGNTYLVGTYTSMQAEHQALVEGMRVASQFATDETEVKLHIDVAPLAKKMRYPDPNSEDWRERRQSYHWLANKFESCELQVTDRSNNKRAHRLAREALFEGRDILREA